MAKEYATFIFDLEDLKLDKETELMIRDLTPGIRKYDARYVRAIISETQEKGGDKLWVRYGVGSQKVPNPYGLKIVQELGEYKGAVKKNKEKCKKKNDRLKIPNSKIQYESKQQMANSRQRHCRALSTVYCLLF